MPAQKAAQTEAPADPTPVAAEAQQLEALPVDAQFHAIPLEVNGYQLVGSPDALASLFRKWSAVLGELNGVEKNGKHPTYNYRYPKEDDVYAVLRPAMARHKLSSNVSITNVEVVGGVTFVHVSVMIGCGDTGSMMFMQWRGSGSDKGDKALQKALTSCVRYFWLKNGLIDADDNELDDGVEARQQAQRPQQRQDRPAPRPQAREPEPEPEADPAEENDGGFYLGSKLTEKQDENGDNYRVRFAWQGRWHVAKGDYARQVTQYIGQSRRFRVDGEDQGDVTMVTNVVVAP